MEPIEEGYYDQIRFWETAKDWQAQIGRVVVWSRFVPGGYGEMRRDYARLVRVTDSGRGVIRFLKDRDGEVVTRTVRLGNLLVPGATGGWGTEMVDHARNTLRPLLGD